jgi:RNA polymerase sigma-70 factor (ECF subfamily)
VFNEGYSASFGESLVRSELCGEAIRLGRLLANLLLEPEALGLLALMLLHGSRRPARVDANGDPVLLEDQDRSLWNQKQIAEGLPLVQKALASRRFGPSTVQAAIAALHAEGMTAAETDWVQISALYSLLARIGPSPVIELNRAVAIAMWRGPLAGIELLDALLAGRELRNYSLAYSARAELCRRAGRNADARAFYERALTLAHHEIERRFLHRRLRQLAG